MAKLPKKQVKLKKMPLFCQSSNRRWKILWYQNKNSLFYRRWLLHASVFKSISAIWEIERSSGTLFISPAACLSLLGDKDSSSACVCQGNYKECPRCHFSTAPTLVLCTRPKEIQKERARSFQFKNTVVQKTKKTIYYMINIPSELSSCWRQNLTMTTFTSAAP